MRVMPFYHFFFGSTKVVRSATNTLGPVYTDLRVISAVEERSMPTSLPVKSSWGICLDLALGMKGPTTAMSALG